MSSGRQGAGQCLTAVLRSATASRATSTSWLRLYTLARANAPWGDRTGEARAGLDAEVYEEGDEIVVDLFHTAEHGVWLEIAMGGVYAIIMPTLEALGPDILRRAGASSLSMEGEE
jgi:hypothetical protein